MDRAPLTKKQNDILEFLKREIIEKGFPPSVREVCDAVHLRSTSSVHAHLEALEKKGYIRKDATKPRAIEIVDDEFKEIRIRQYMDSVEASKSEASPDGMVKVPVLEELDPAKPLFAAEQIDSYFPLPAAKLPQSQTFMVRMRGESMTDIGILDGDHILVKRQETAENGDMVLAVSGDTVLVRTFYQEFDQIRLQPENEYMTPLFLSPEEPFRILGVLIGVFRLF